MSAKIEKIMIENYRSFGSDNNSIFMCDDVIFGIKSLIMRMD